MWNSPGTLHTWGPCRPRHRSNDYPDHPPSTAAGHARNCMIPANRQPTIPLTHFHSRRAPRPRGRSAKLGVSPETARLPKKWGLAQTRAGCTLRIRGA